MTKYAIGVDFGTESGRALLVDVADGREVATDVHPYANGVIDERLPDANIRLEPDWALQDPNDYLEVFKHGIPAVLKESGVDPADVIGLGHRLHGLHHAADQGRRHAALLPARVAQPARTPGSSCGSTTRPSLKPTSSTRSPQREGCDFLDRYGGKISSEWFVPKAWQILDEAPGDLRRRRPADRGRRLGHLAVDRRRDAQPHAPPATRGSGRSARASRRTRSSRRSTRGWSTWSMRRCRARSRELGSKAGGLTERGRGAGPACNRAPPSPSPMWTRMSPCPPPPSPSRAAW